MAWLVHFVLLYLLFCQSTLLIRCNDEEDNLLQGINAYGTSLNLTALTKSDRAGCLAGEVAFKLKDQPCTAPNTQYPGLISKCHFNVTDVQILPVCVLDPALVLSIFTTPRYMNDTRFTAIGIGSQDNWIVVVLTTSTPHGALFSILEILGVDLTSVRSPQVVLSIIACIASFALFVIHPFLSSLNELYLVCLFLSTFIWVTMEMVYILVILSLASDTSKQTMLVILSTLVIIVQYLILWVSKEYIYVGNIAGFIGIIAGILMYMSPIYILWDKSTTLLPQLGCGISIGLSLCILACISSSFYPYIAITNGIGALIQLYLIRKHISDTHPAVVEQVRLLISESRGLKLWNIS